MITTRNVLAVLGTALVAGLLGWVAFTPDAAESNGAEPGVRRSDDVIAGRVTVLAAASLAEPFEELASRLADQHPGLDVSLSFGPSSTLAQQAIAGAPADVLATADTATMDVAVNAGIVAGRPEIFARNTLALVVPAGNPGHVDGLADVARDDLRVAVCAPEVPCGAAAERVFDAAGVTAVPDTLATDVKEALALVTLGEADAALVYQTDAVAAGDDVETVPTPETSDVVNEYPVAQLADAPNPEAAALVIDTITGDAGRAALLAHGFLGP